MRIKKSTYFEPLWLRMSTNTIILVREIFGSQHPGLCMCAINDERLTLHTYNLY